MREALRYLNNANEILRSVLVEDNTCIDIKPVQEAWGIAHFAIVMVIDRFLLKKGITEKEWPQPVDGYRHSIQNTRRSIMANY